MKKPLIGISTLLFKDVTGATPANPMTGRFFANRSFVRSVIEAGGVPVLLPGTFDKACIDEYLDLCDGFIMVGGPDANPVLFGEEPSEKARMGNTTVDMHDTAMIRAVLAMDKPILGVCRGMQMLNAQIQSNPALAAYRSELEAFYKKCLNYQAMKEDVAKIYLEVFTPDELRQLIAFYKSPTGKMFLKKTPELTVKVTMMTQDIIAKTMPELIKAIQAKTQQLQQKK